MICQSHLLAHSLDHACPLVSQMGLLIVLDASSPWVVPLTPMIHSLPRNHWQALMVVLVIWHQSLLFAWSCWQTVFPGRCPNFSFHPTNTPGQHVSLNFGLTYYGLPQQPIFFSHGFEFLKHGWSHWRLTIGVSHIVPVLIQPNCDDATSHQVMQSFFVQWWEPCHLWHIQLPLGPMMLQYGISVAHWDPSNWQQHLTWCGVQVNWWVTIIRLISGIHVEPQCSQSHIAQQLSTDQNNLNTAVPKFTSENITCKIHVQSPNPQLSTDTRVANIQSTVIQLSNQWVNSYNNEHQPQFDLPLLVTIATNTKLTTKSICGQ